MSLTVLLVGSGGREHALAWKLAQSPDLARLIVAPGNPGMEGLGERVGVAADDIAGLIQLARSIHADLVVVGPEAPLAAGLADRLAEAGIPCFGPTASAARLESSKGFTRAFAERHSLPGARHGAFTEAGPARAFLDTLTPPYVVKADGLAAGKGVVVTEDRAEADAAVDRLLGAGPVVIEQFLTGQEASLFALCDGETAIPFGGAQDHKRAFDGDLGPNTGGMGAYTPAPILTAETHDRAWREILEPTVAGMAAEGALFRGVLYAGLMIDDGRPRLVEYNARFGDPECQALMLRLDSDLLPYLHAAAVGRLDRLPAPRWRDEAVVAVVLAASGYPEHAETGSIIRGAEADFGPDVVVFHAGTRRAPDGALTAAGGRVLTVCARGADVSQARHRAYAAVDAIDWPGGFHRRDIGWRALDVASRRP